MSKIITHEFVLSEVENAGYKLHSKYERAIAKLDLECKDGHRYKATWCSFKTGTRCPQCAGLAKLTHEFVLGRVENAGFTLLSQYKNCRSKLEVMCAHGHRHKVTWINFKKGAGCPHCSGMAKLTHEFVSREIEKVSGCSLISKYKNSKAKLEIECADGHRYKTTWFNFKAGRRCPRCAMHGFNPDKPASLYYIRFDHNGKLFYKIGITNLTIAKRFREEPMPYAVIMETRYLLGFLAAEAEQEILTRHKKHRYQGDPFLKSGNTELFTKDVLRLDKSCYPLRTDGHHARLDSTYSEKKISNILNSSLA